MYRYGPVASVILWGMVEAFWSFWQEHASYIRIGGYLVPKWWQKRPQLTREAPLHSNSTAIRSGLHAWVEFTTIIQSFKELRATWREIARLVALAWENWRRSRNHNTTFSSGTKCHEKKKIRKRKMTYRFSIHSFPMSAVYVAFFFLKKKNTHTHGVLSELFTSSPILIQLRRMHQHYLSRSYPTR